MVGVHVIDKYLHEYNKRKKKEYAWIIMCTGILLHPKMQLKGPA